MSANRKPARGPLLSLREGRRAAARVRELRAVLTQAQLAVKAGRSPAWVARREQGRVRLSVADAELLAGALGVPLTALTGEAP